MNADRLGRAPQFNRHLVLSVLFVVLIAGLCCRLVYLHLVEDDFLKSKGDALSKRSLSLKSYRGMILDRNGQALAVSTPVKSVWINATQIDLSEKNWAVLLKALNLSKLQLKNKINAHPNASFLYLKRHVSPLLSDKIANLELSGVYSQTEYRRYYPAGEVFAQIVGHTGVDHIGQEGIELAHNTRLEGKSGTHRVLKDRSGASVESLGKRINPTQGEDVILSLDARIQYLAYKELSQACQQHKAKSASLVVLDVDTFEVLAMVNVPTYNPNFSSRFRTPAHIRNRAVTDQFEPGSVIKPFSMVHVLASGQYGPDNRVVDTSPGWMVVGNGHKIVKDTRSFGNMTFTEVLQKSSNVGIAKLVLSLPPTHLYKTFDKMGFGKITQSGFPGETPGRIAEDGKKNPFALATLSFGYGMAVTPLQLAQSYAILAAGGIKRPVRFIKLSKPDYVEQKSEEQSDEKLDNRTRRAIKQVNQMLATTSEMGGTAYKARVPGYTIAGKTGTVRKLMNNGAGYGYSTDKHLAIFAGFAPVKHPKLAIAVIIDEPEVKYYGGEVSAPVFSKVMEGALRILAVPRDNNA